jgi:hypothetical protein
MKALNLDSLVGDERTVTLDGVVHKVREMSVTDFVAASQEAKRLEKMGAEADTEVNLKSSVDHIARVLPTIPRERLESMSLRQLGVLVSFVNGTLEAQSEKLGETPIAAEAGNGQAA